MWRIPVWETNEENLKASIVSCPSGNHRSSHPDFWGWGSESPDIEGKIPPPASSLASCLPVDPRVWWQLQKRSRVTTPWVVEDRDHWWPPHRKVMGEETRGNRPAVNWSTGLGRKVTRKPVPSRAWTRNRDGWDTDLPPVLTATDTEMK